PGDYPRARHLKLVALPTHRLHQDGEVQLSAPRDGPRVGGIGVFDFQRAVSLQLLEQPLPDLAGSDEFSVSAGEWRVVNQKIHRDRRLLDRDSSQPLRMLEIGHCEPDFDSLQSGQRDDLTRGNLWNLDSIEALVREEFRHAGLLCLLRTIEWQ